MENWYKLALEEERLKILATLSNDQLTKEAGLSDILKSIPIWVISAVMALSSGKSEGAVKDQIAEKFNLNQNQFSYLEKIISNKSSVDEIISAVRQNQLNKEMRAEIENGMASEFIAFEEEWGIVSIQGTMFPGADPIPPSTIIRNKLGVNFGGSGAEINKDEYEDSIRFWEANALIK